MNSDQTVGISTFVEAIMFRLVIALLLTVSPALSFQIPEEILQRKVPLREGIGAVHDPTETSSPEAQRYHDQGMTYLHCYVWIEAARSFREALRLDPALLPSWAGLSRAYMGMNEIGGARRAVEVGASAATPGSPRRERTRLRIEELRVRATESGSPGDLMVFLAAVNEALDADPDDPELWLIRGNAEELAPTAIGQQGGVTALGFYRWALELAPVHPGPHHYLVHTCENIGDMDCALRYGRSFAVLAPQIPHALHMYGHNLRRVGRIAEATDAFLAAEKLENDYYRKEGIPPEYDWHHAHNLSLLGASLRHQGKIVEAEKRYRQVLEVSGGKARKDFYRPEWSEFLLETGRPDEALAAARELIADPSPKVQAAGHDIAGLAFLEKGEKDQARRELAKGNGEGKEMLGALLDGLLLLDGPEKERGEKILEENVATLRRLPGPDAWMVSLFRIELVGRLARKADDLKIADLAAREMTAHDPAYGGSRLAAALAAEMRGDTAKARENAAAAESLWKSADPDLPELREIRRILGRK